MSDIAKIIGGLVALIYMVWSIATPSAEEVRKEKAEAEEWSAKCGQFLVGNKHPRTPSIQSVLTSTTASAKEKKAAVYEACSAYGLTDDFRNFGRVDPNPGVSPEEMIRRAHEQAEISNRQLDQTMEDMITDYRKRAKSSRSSATAAGRIDMFEMPDGTTVICGTNFRNGARVTTCN